MRLTYFDAERASERERDTDETVKGSVSNKHVRLESPPAYAQIVTNPTVLRVSDNTSTGAIARPKKSSPAQRACIRGIPSMPPSTKQLFLVRFLSLLIPRSNFFIAVLPKDQTHLSKWRFARTFPGYQLIRVSVLARLGRCKAPRMWVRFCEIVDSVSRVPGRDRKKGDGRE